jgi:hypothetical protein
MALVRNDVSEERSVSVIRLTRIGELRKLAVNNNRRSSENSVLATATRPNIPEDGIFPEEQIVSYSAKGLPDPREEMFSDFYQVT